MQALQLDLFEPNYNMWVGQLCMHVTNQGITVDPEDLQKSPRGGTSSPKKYPSPSRRAKIDPSTGKVVDFAATRPTKRIKSRPLDQPASDQDPKDGTSQLQKVLTQIGTEYDYRNEHESVLASDSQAARKRLRIARMKKQSAKESIGANAEIFRDPNAFDWQKE